MIIYKMKKIMFNERYGLQQAVLDRRKTMTRRVVKCPKKFKGVEDIELEFHKRLDQDFYYDCVVVDPDGHELGQLPLPYEVGDVVAIAQAYKTDEVLTFNAYNKDGSPRNDGAKRHKEMLNSEGYRNKEFVKAEYMPHHIRITDLRFERLQDISDKDAMKEGVCEIDELKIDKFTPWPLTVKPYKYNTNNVKAFYAPRYAFAHLFKKVCGSRVWNENPWVVAYTFELVD